MEMRQGPIWRRRTFLAVMGATTASALLAACGGAEATSTTAPAGARATTAPQGGATTAPAVGTAAPAVARTAAATPTTAASPAAARKPAGNLKAALGRKVITLDPTGAESVERVQLTISEHIFDRLVARDPKSGDFRPALATKWEAPEPTVWTFTLRPDAKFHDGSPVAAADVKATVERIQRQKGPLAPLWATLDSVEAADPTTVRFKFKAPFGTALANASLLSVLPAAKMEQEGFFQQPVGSGPFKLAAFKPDVETRLEATTGHWGGNPGLQSVQFVEIPEVVARMTAIDTGEIDFTQTIPSDQLPTLRKNANLKIETTPNYAYYFIWMNAKRGPFANKAVRQAMAYALDVDAIVKELTAGIGRRATAPIPSTVFGHAPQTPYNYDPQRAKKLLADAGFPSGFQTEVIWSPGTGPQDREILQALIAYWDAIGVKVKSGELERAIWLDRLLKLDWDMDFQTNAVQTGDADFTLRRLYTSAANRNGYANPDLDKLLNDAAATTDQQRRAEFYAQANKIIWEEAVGIFPIELVENYVYKKTVTGFVPAPSDVPSFRTVTIA